MLKADFPIRLSRDSAGPKILKQGLVVGRIMAFQRCSFFIPGN